MKKINSLDGLAKALENNDWVPSKTTEKTIAIMSGLSNIPWDKVKLFTLRWESVGEIVPFINIMMHGQDEEGEPKIDVEMETNWEKEDETGPQP